MATSSVVIAGATYSDVPSITVKNASNQDVSYVLTSDATASAETILQGYTAYVNGVKVEGTATGGGGGGIIITDEIDEHGGTIRHITGTPTQSQTKTVTPTKSTQTVRPDTDYMLTSVTVNPIPNQYIDTTDANATATDVVANKTAYVNGVKVTGSLVTQSYYTGSGAPSSSLGTDGDIYFDIS